MANELEYVLRLNAASFDRPLREALSSVRAVDAGTRRLGSSVDGIRTSMTNAGAGAESLFDKLGRLGANLSNVVNGVKSANEVLGFLRQRGQAAAAANTAVAATSAAAGAGVRGVGVAATAAGAGLGVMAGGALGAVTALGAVAAVAVPLVAAMGAVTAGVAAAGLAYKGAVKGVSLAADLEQDMIAFKTLTGDMRAAKGVLEELIDLASATPFQLPDLTGASRTLLAANVPVQALRSELTALGNVSAATGARIGSLATVYGQVAGKGKLYAEELQQFVEQGAGALRGAVAETLGVTTAQLMDMMQKGQVGFSALQQAIQSLAGAGGKWADAMQEQSQTTWGLLSTVKDNVDGIFRAFGQPINDGPVKAALQELVRLSETTKELVVAAIADGEIEQTLHDVFIIGLDMAKQAAWEAAKEIASALATGLDALANPTKSAVKFALEADAESVDTSADEARRRLEERLSKVKVKMELDSAKNDLASDLEEKTRRLRKAQGQSGAPDWAKARDAVEEPADKDKGGGSGEAARGWRPLEVMKLETAIILAQAQGQQGLAEILRRKLEVLKETQQIMQQTGLAEAQAAAIAQQRVAAQTAITGAAEAEARAKKEAAEQKASAEKASQQGEALNLLKAEFAILHAKATGQNQLADALQRELNIRQEAKRIAEATGMAEERALQIARQKADLEEKANGAKGGDSRYGADGRRLSDGRMKITGFSRDRDGLRPFAGLDEFYGMQRARMAGVGPGERFKSLKPPGSAPGITPPGMASRAQQRKEAEAAAAKAVQPRWDLVEMIDKRLASLGLL